MAKYPEWIVRRVLASEPGMANIPARLLNRLELPDNESELKGYADVLRDIYAEAKGEKVAANSGSGGGGSIDPQVRTFVEKQKASEAKQAQIDAIVKNIM